MNHVAIPWEKGKLLFIECILPAEYLFLFAKENLLLQNIFDVHTNTHFDTLAKEAQAVFNSIIKQDL